MREILFRGKRIDGKGWAYGYFVENEDDIYRAFIVSSARWDVDGDGCTDLLETEVYEVDPVTVGQFTGLCDKNGKQIFEGDVVRYQFDNDDCPFPNKHTEKIIGRIFFSDWRASFSVTAGKSGSDMLNNDLFNYVRNGNRVEAIGNIYDNTELLNHDAN